MLVACGSGAPGGCAAGPPASGRDAPPKYSEFCPAPNPGEAGWRTATPGEAGLRSDGFERLVRDARDGRLGKLHSVLVVRNGVLVFEAYFGGANRDHCQLIASVTKSVTSLLVGMSLERSPGYTVDTPLAGFLPQYAEVLGRDGGSAITMLHALTMTAGLEWDEYTYPHPDDRNPNTQMYRQDDPKRFILSRSRDHPPGETWAYNSGLSVIAGATVRTMTGLSIDRFAEQRLFGPLGIDRYHWFKHADGTVYSNGDLLLTPRDLTKIGLLVLDQGQWRGLQVVPRRWIAVSTRQHVATPGGLGYGYSWWLGSAIRGGRRFHVLFASGTDGQRLFIVPQLGLVVTVTAQLFGNRAGPMAAAAVLADYVIPAALPEAGAEPSAYPDEALLASAVGTYVDARSGHTVRIVRENGALFMLADPIAVIGSGAAKVELTPIAANRFQGYWQQIGTVVLDIVTDGSGEVVGGNANVVLRNRYYRKTD